MRRARFRAPVRSRLFLPCPCTPRGASHLTVCNTGAVDIDVWSHPRAVYSARTSAPRRARCRRERRRNRTGISGTCVYRLSRTVGRGAQVRRRSLHGRPRAPLGNQSGHDFLGREKDACRSQSAHHGGGKPHDPARKRIRAAAVALQPGYPECRNVATGNSATVGNTDDRRRTTVCEDLGYTLTVEAYPDSREINLGALGVGGFFSDGPLGTTIVHDKVEMNWAEATEARKVREAPQPINWTDLLSSSRSLNREQAQLGRAVYLARLDHGARDGCPPSKSESTRLTPLPTFRSRRSTSVNPLSRPAGRTKSSTRRTDSWTYCGTCSAQTSGPA